MVPSLEELRKVNRTFPLSDPVRRWKENGGRVVGWCCIYAPEEIIMAAGMLPIRVTGDSAELPLESANAYIYTNNCSFMRSCFELGITGQFDFLDGLVTCFVCRGIRLLSDIWRRYINIPIIYSLDVPRAVGDEGWLSYYRGQLEQLLGKVAEFSGRTVGDAELREAIGVRNHTRKLLGRLYELRKRPAPPVTGAETMEITNAAVRMPPAEFNRVLENLLQELEGRSVSGEHRLMLLGSIMNNPRLLEGIEELGGLIVADELCTGLRYWWGAVDEGTDPLEALARRYFNVLPCACMEPPQRRIQRILELVKEYRVEGVIIALQRNCYPYILDQPVVLMTLREAGIPFLEVDLEYGAGFSGQLRTRVEAFLEMLD